MTAVAAIDHPLEERRLGDSGPSRGSGFLRLVPTRRLVYRGYHRPAYHGIIRRATSSARPTAHRRRAHGVLVLSAAVLSETVLVLDCGGEARRRVAITTAVSSAHPVHCCRVDSSTSTSTGLRLEYEHDREQASNARTVAITRRRQKSFHSQNARLRRSGSRLGSGFFCGGDRSGQHEWDGARVSIPRGNRPRNFLSVGIVLVLSEAVLSATVLVLDCGGEARKRLAINVSFCGLLRSSLSRGFEYEYRAAP